MKSQCSFRGPACCQFFQWAWLVACLCVMSGAQAVFSQDKLTRVYENGELPADVRLKPLKDLDGYFPFEPPADLETWERRAERVRNQIKVALGLVPMPTRCPLNTKLHGRIEMEEYSVEKVYFESLPGFVVTGNLYRPRGDASKNDANKDQKRPGILCPHGHWDNGRFYDAGDEEVARQIEVGAEKFKSAAHSPLQARCVHLARMGCVVFHYDMIGYADSQQIGADIAHRFAKPRPEMNTEKNWGLFSPQAEAHLQSVMGLQTYNSIRALDFLESLPDVDSQKLGATGGSGGGTQTMLLAAIDPRLSVGFPAVMVSTSMQGGCTCENCSLLRIGTGNVEFAALFAPKPQGISAANDWTKEVETKGFPQLKQLYGLYGAEDNIGLISRTEFMHNYNMHSRAAMYELFNQHFGLEADLAERDFQRLSTEQMTVWNDDHPQPAGGPDFERKLLAGLHQDAETRLASIALSDAVEDAGDSRPDKREQLIEQVTDALIGRRHDDPQDFEWLIRNKIEMSDVASDDVAVDGVLLMTGKLRNKTHGEELPLLFLYPGEWNGEVVIWISERGKQHPIEDAGGENAGAVRASAAKLLANGFAIGGVDVFMQGEFLKPDEKFDRTRKVDNPREAAAYTFGYNRSVFVQRVHDIMSVALFARGYEEHPAQEVHLIGLDRTASIVNWAGFALGEKIDSFGVSNLYARLRKTADIDKPRFMPGNAKYQLLIERGAANRQLLGNRKSAATTPEEVARELKAAEVQAVEWIVNSAK